MKHIRMNWIRRLIIACVLPLVGGQVIIPALADDVAFQTSFDTGFTLENPSEGVGTNVQGATHVAGHDQGQAARVGRVGDEWRQITYHRTPHQAEREQAGREPALLPLSEGRLAFDFRPEGWAIGDSGEFALINIDGPERVTLYVRYVVRQGTPYLQVIYGTLGQQAGDQPARAMVRAPIAPLSNDDWHQVEVAWDNARIVLTVDGTSESIDRRHVVTPPEDGHRLHLAVPYVSQQQNQLEGFVDIDNLIISRQAFADQNQARERFPHVVIGQVKNGATVDGLMDDAVWQRAALVRGFLRLGQADYAAHQPQVWLGYDERKLYVAVRSPLHGQSDLKADADAGPLVFEDDRIELFLAPDADEDGYVQVAVNSRGALMAQAHRRGERTPLRGMERIEAAARIAPDDWTLELAIPFDVLPGVKGPPAEDPWLFNVCESRAGMGHFSLAALRTFHQRDGFGQLVFGGNSPRIRMESLGSIRHGEIELCASHAGNAETPVEMMIVGRRYDETADTDFALFTERVAIDAEPRFVFKADLERMTRTGTIHLRATSDGQSIYEARLPYQVMKGIEIESLRVIRDGDRKHLRVRTVQPFASGLSDGQQVRVTLRRESGETVRELASAIDGEKMDLHLDLADVPVGNYRAHMRLEDHGGGIAAEAEPRSFVAYGDPPPWQGNQLGVSDRVPPPWTPMEVETFDEVIEVRCWNRAYSFSAASLLPASIYSAGANYLVAPMTFVLETGGRAGPIGAASHEVIESSEKRVRLRSEVTSDWGALRTETTIDFDGFIWVDLTTTPRQSGTISALKMQWRMPGERSTLLHAGYRHLNDSGETPRQWHKRLSSGQGPVWVGDEQGGISLAVESFQNWHNADADRQFELQANDEQTTLTMNLIDQPVPVSGELNFGFCLHPTPVRPQPEGHRKLRHDSWSAKLRSGMDYPINFSPWHHTSRYQGAPVWAVTDEELQWYFQMRNQQHDPSYQTHAGMREAGVRSTWYVGYRQMSPNVPGFIWAGQAWRTRDRDIHYGGQIRSYHRDMVSVCPVEDFRDWWLWQLDRSKHQYPEIDGIYFDLMGWTYCDREDHGHGVRDAEGELHGSYPIRDSREWLLRVYTYLKQQDPNTPMLLHLSGQAPKIMGYSFTDYIWTGELGIRDVQEHGSYAYLDLAAFRAEALAQAWGPTKLWITQLQRAAGYLPPDERDDAIKPWAARHYLGLLMLHDIPLRSNGAHRDVVVELWRVFDRFDLDDSDRMMPYWTSAQGVEIAPDHDEIVGTAYVKATRALIVLLNNTDEAADVPITLDLSRLFERTAGPVRIYDAESGSEVAREPSFEVHTSKRDFKLLVIDVQGDGAIWNR